MKSFEFAHNRKEAIDWLAKKGIMAYHSGLGVELYFPNPEPHKPTALCFSWAQVREALGY